MTVTTPQVRSSTPTAPRTLRPFLVATFAPSWGVGILLTIVPDEAASVFGPMGSTSPGVVAISVIPTAMFNASRGSLLGAFVLEEQPVVPPHRYA